MDNIQQDEKIQDIDLKESRIDDLTYTQDLRKFIIDKLMADKPAEKNNLKTIRVVAGLLADMDHQSLGVLKVKIEEENGKNQEEIKRIIAGILHEYSPTAGKLDKPIEKDPSTVSIGLAEGNREHVKDEDKIGVNNETIDDFYRTLNND